MVFPHKHFIPRSFVVSPFLFYDSIILSSKPLAMANVTNIYCVPFTLWKVYFPFAYLFKLDQSI